MFKMDFWNQFVSSIIKTGQYEELIQRSTGKAVLYLLLLTFIVTLAYGINIAIYWNNSVDEMTNAFVNGPQFLLADGVLEVKAPMPYVISNSKDVIKIVDTSGKTDENILRGHKYGFFIGKDKAVLKLNEVESQTYNYDDLRMAKGDTVTKAMMIEVFPRLKWLNVLIVLGLFIYDFLANLTAALILSLGGLLTSMIINHRIMFNDLYKISIYALTLPLVLELAKELAGIDIPYFKLSFYSIAITYVVMALLLLKNKSDSSSPVE